MALFRKIEDKFPSKKEDLDLLRYFYFEAIHLFTEGLYEMAYFSAYKVIGDKTVVDPKEYISDKRDGEPSRFSIIRAMLLHSRVKDAKVDPKQIVQIGKKLPYFTLEIIERATEFIKKLAIEDSLKANGQSK